MPDFAVVVERKSGIFATLHFITFERFPMNRKSQYVLLVLMAASILFLFSVLVFAQEDATPSLNRSNWPKTVGFSPDLKVEGYEVGMTIHSDNAQQFKSILPDPVALMVEKYGMTLETRKYEPYAPSNGFIELTKKQWKKAKLLDIGNSIDKRELAQYEGGMPFPKPENGRQIAWNFTLSYGGDDGENIFSVLWITGKRGVERSEVWKTTSIRRAKHRTDIPPIPDVPFLVEKGVYAATLTEALEPADKKGYASLYYGYIEPKEPNGWLYMPTQRRSIRLAFGLKGEAWNNTDLLYEDVRGYTGSPEWMNWKLLKKTTMLCPMHAGVEYGKGKEGQAYDLKTKPHWNPIAKWELRPVYVVEATPKMKGYPYSRMLFWIDAESSYILAKSAYDRKGLLWKVLINGANASENPRKQPPRPAFSVIVDLNLDHATAFFWHKQRSNIGVNPKSFTQTTLRKLGM